jgi:hypothetical protein
MKKILLTLLMGGFCCLMASAAGAGEGYVGVGYDEVYDDGVGVGGNLHNDVEAARRGAAEDDFPAVEKPTSGGGSGAAIPELPRMKVVGMPDILTYEGSNYVEQSTETWAHDFGSRLSIQNTRKFIATPDGEIQTAEISAVAFPHLDVRPEKSEEEICLWIVKSVLQITRNHHTSTGGMLTQFVIKDGFRIDTYHYTREITRLFRVVDGVDTVLNTEIVNHDPVKGAQLVGKKGKAIWFNDPAGQGSNGLCPSTQAEIKAAYDYLLPI